MATGLMTQKKWILAAGGTGGHVFPALALYRTLTARGDQVLFLTDPRGEKYLGDVPPDSKKTIASGGLVGGSIPKRLGGLFKLVKGYMASRRVLGNYKPAAVIGFGGYPSAPPLLAAQHKKNPTVLHEQNSVMGKANRLVARKASAVATSFDDTRGAPANAVQVGNPVRHDISLVGEGAYLAPVKGEPFNILVLGGSLGASFLSTAVPKALALLTADQRSTVRLTIQARSSDLGEASEILANADIEFTASPFIEDVAGALATAHFVICRSGASSVAEIAAARRPALFIPLDIHKDRHQELNAAALADKGAARVEPQSQTSPEALARHISTFIDNPKQLETLADLAFSCARPNATVDLVALIDSVVPGE